MNKSKYSITFACHNSVEYTKLCIESMIAHGTPLDRLVVVDNGSTDSTREYLSTIPLGKKIYNKKNLGCGLAWNQGALAFQSEWTIVMNNDVMVSVEWIENLINTAESQKLKVISPALVEGALDYDFPSFQAAAKKKMGNVHRIGDGHAICLAIHESVWLDVGYFRSTPKLYGYEDTIFFHELKTSNIQIGMTGSSWIHHYGSITQNEMRKELGLKQKDSLSSRYNYKLLNQSWLERKLSRIKRKKIKQEFRQDELAKYEMTLHGLRKNSEFEWL